MSSPFAACALVCPRCRHVDASGALVVGELVDVATRAPAIPGELDASFALSCTRCAASYPVVQGIAVVLSSPEAIVPEHTPLVDPTGVPLETLLAALDGHAPGSELVRSSARLGRWAMAHFRDRAETRIGPPPPVNDADGAIHALDVMAWLEARSPSSAGDLLGVMGSGPGREAWESTCPTLLVDAHLPSLLLSRRLAKEGFADVAVPRDARSFRGVRLRCPDGPRSPVAWVCADVHDPPFRAGVLTRTVAENLVDSVADPTLAFRQLAALTAPSGSLVVTSPFAFREEVTPVERWLGDARTSAADALVAIARGSRLRLEDRRELPFTLRAHDREAATYTSLGLAFRKDPR
jgi:uncharacterized protein YbaR (Trm112 family)